MRRLRFVEGLPYVPNMLPPKPEGQEKILRSKFLISGLQRRQRACERGPFLLFSGMELLTPSVSSSDVANTIIHHGTLRIPLLHLHARFPALRVGRIRFEHPPPSLVSRRCRIRCPDNRTANRLQ